MLVRAFAWFEFHHEDQQTICQTTRDTSSSSSSWYGGVFNSSQKGISYCAIVSSYIF